MSLASTERQTDRRKTLGQAAAAAAFVLAAGVCIRRCQRHRQPRPRAQNPALAGNTPRYDQSTAVYDISAHMVYLPDGTRLEAHSGLGCQLDDPGRRNIRMRGVTPPHMYELTPREALFHGVPALRLNPVGGEEAIYGRIRPARAHLHARPQRRFQRLRLVPRLQRLPECLSQPGHQAAGRGRTDRLSGAAALGATCRTNSRLIARSSQTIVRHSGAMRSIEPESITTIVSMIPGRAKRCVPE